MGPNLITPSTKTNSKIDEQTRQFAIAAMNEGGRLSKTHERAALSQALQSYTQAIQLLRASSINADNCNALSAALCNRAQLSYRIHGLAESTHAIDDYKQAIKVLEPHLNKTNGWIPLNYAGAQANLANVLLDLRNLPEAKERAKHALETIQKAKMPNSSHLQVELLCHRTLCDIYGQELPQTPAEVQMQVSTEALEHVERALAIIQSLRRKEEPEPFVELSERIFRFGSQLIAITSPEKLRNCIQNHLRSLNSSVFPLFSEIACEAISLAVNTLSEESLRSIHNSDTLDVQQKAVQNLFLLHNQLETEASLHVHKE